jgi:hypothetical protein
MTKLSLSLVEPVPRQKSKAAQLAELLPEIEVALVAGHTHRVIFEQVEKAIGLNLTFGYYQNTIHRIRQRKEAAAKKLAAPAPAPRKIPPNTLSTSPATGAQAMDAPTSKLQEALSEPVDDFFS